jgi:hypothetical protein
MLLLQAPQSINSTRANQPSTIMTLQCTHAEKDDADKKKAQCLYRSKPAKSKNAQGLTNNKQIYQRRQSTNTECQA